MDKQHTIKVASQLLAEHYPGLDSGTLQDRLDRLDNTTDLLTRRQYASRHQISVRTVDRMIADGALAVVRIGRRSVRIRV